MYFLATLCKLCFYFGYINRERNDISLLQKMTIKYINVTSSLKLGLVTNEDIECTFLINHCILEHSVEAKGSLKL